VVSPRRTQYLPLGVLLTLAGLLALAGVADARTPPVSAVAGLALLALAAALAGDRRGAAVVLAIPGAALVGFGGDLARGGTDCLAIATTLAVVLLAPLVADADRSWSSVGAAPVALAVSGAGLYLCVPDTEEATVLAVVLVAGAVVSRLGPLRTLGRVGAPPIVALYLWVGAYDARGREAAFVGVVGALALLVLEPVGARLRGARPPGLTGPTAIGVLLAGQVGLAAYASRVPGLETSVPRAVALLAPAVVVGTALGAIAGAPRPLRPDGGRAPDAVEP
jgi:hypothetical protein